MIATKGRNSLTDDKFNEVEIVQCFITKLTSFLIL